MDLSRAFHVVNCTTTKHPRTSRHPIPYRKPLMPRTTSRTTSHRPLTTQEKILTTRLAIEIAKRDKLREEVGDLLAPPSPYVRYKDLRPPRPEERERFYVRLRQYVEEANRVGDQEKYERYMSMTHHAP